MSLPLLLGRGRGGRHVCHISHPNVTAHSPAPSGRVEIGEGENGARPRPTAREDEADRDRHEEREEVRLQANRGVVCEPATERHHERGCGAEQTGRVRHDEAAEPVRRDHDADRRADGDVFRRSGEGQTDFHRTGKHDGEEKVRVSLDGSLAGVKAEPEPVREVLRIS